MRINKNGISNGVKTRYLEVIFIIFLLLTLGSGLVVFLTQEKSQPIVDEQLSLVENRAEPAAEALIEAVADEPAKVESVVPKKDKISPTPFVEEGNKVAVPAEEKNNTAIIISGVKYEAAVKPGSSVYDLMNLLSVENKINFSGKDYSGLGFFVEEINGLKNNPTGANWLYYINGQPAPVGVSYYKIKSDDIIEWKYEKRSF